VTFDTIKVTFFPLKAIVCKVKIKINMHIAIIPFNGIIYFALTVNYTCGFCRKYGYVYVLKVQKVD
jgi:hypothetical protein